MLALLVGVVDILIGSRMRLEWRQRALLATAVVLLAFAWRESSGVVGQIVYGKCAIFENIDFGAVVRSRPTLETLGRLNPVDQTSFFASLGDFLMCPIEDKACKGG